MIFALFHPSLPRLTPHRRRMRATYLQDAYIFHPLRIYRADPNAFAPRPRAMVAYTYAYPVQLQQLVTTPHQGSSPCILHASLHVLVVYITWSCAHRYGTARFPHYSFPSFSRSRFSLGRDDLSIKPVHCAMPGFPPPPSLSLSFPFSPPPPLRLQLLLATIG